MMLLNVVMKLQHEITVSMWYNDNLNFQIFVEQFKWKNFHATDGFSGAHNPDQKETNSRRDKGTQSRTIKTKRKITWKIERYEKYVFEAP